MSSLIFENIRDWSLDSPKSKNHQRIFIEFKNKLDTLNLSFSDIQPVKDYTYPISNICICSLYKLNYYYKISWTLTPYCSRAFRHRVALKRGFPGIPFTAYWKVLGFLWYYDDKFNKMFLRNIRYILFGSSNSKSSINDF